MLFSQPCRSSHWMWCSMYRWNIHWLACSTRLVGNHDISIYVCSGPKMRFPTISALWKLVLLYSFGGDNMGLLVLFCLNVTRSTRSILPFAVSLFGQLRGCFLKLRSRWFEKKFSPLIFFSFRLLFLFPFLSSAFWRDLLLDFIYDCNGKDNMHNFILLFPKSSVRSELPTVQSRILGNLLW